MASPSGTHTPNRRDMDDRTAIAYRVMDNIVPTRASVKATSAAPNRA